MTSAHVIPITDGIERTLTTNHTYASAFHASILYSHIYLI